MYTSVVSLLELSLQLVCIHRSKARRSAFLDFNAETNWSHFSKQIPDLSVFFQTVCLSAPWKWSWILLSGIYCIFWQLLLCGEAEVSMDTWTSTEAAMLAHCTKTGEKNTLWLRKDWCGAAQSYAAQMATTEWLTLPSKHRGHLRRRVSSGLCLLFCRGRLEGLQVWEWKHVYSRVKRLWNER